MQQHEKPSVSDGQSQPQSQTQSQTQSQPHPDNTAMAHGAPAPGRKRIRAAKRPSFAAFLMSIPPADAFDEQDFARIQ